MNEARYKAHLTETEERTLQIDADQATTLARMGVQVWYERKATLSSPAAQAVVGERPASEAPQAAVQAVHERVADIVVPEVPVEGTLPVAFDWVAGQKSFILYPAQAASRAYLQFLRDVLLSIDWLEGSRDAGTNIQRGEFRWPQVTSEGVGSPDRSLLAFADKYALKDRRVVYAPELAAEVNRFGDTLGVPLLALSVGAEAMADPVAKASLWAELTNR